MSNWLQFSSNLPNTVCKNCTKDNFSPSPILEAENSSLMELIWSQHICRLPIKIPHHKILELRWDAPTEAWPWQQPLCLSLLHLVCLMAGLPLEVWVTQGHTDVIKEARQRTQFDDGILWLKEKESFAADLKNNTVFELSNVRVSLKCHISTSAHLALVS